MHTWPPLDLLIEPALILWPVLTQILQKDLTKNAFGHFTDHYF